MIQDKYEALVRLAWEARDEPTVSSRLVVPRLMDAAIDLAEGHALAIIAAWPPGPFPASVALRIAAASQELQALRPKEGR